VPAAHLCRALFEESARWSWVDEDRESRRAAFVVEAARAHELIVEAAEGQGVDPTPLFGEMANWALAAAEGETVRFPRRFEDLFDWTRRGFRRCFISSTESSPNTPTARSCPPGARSPSVMDRW
jgi:hypothetical protein